MDQRDGCGDTALLDAARPMIVQALLDASADVHATNWARRTPLHIAAANRNVEVVEMLLERGASPESMDKNHSTPLHAAASTGNAEIVKLLLEQGASVDATDTHGSTPLHAAMAHRPYLTAEANRILENVKTLLERDANPAAQDREGRTPRDLASRFRYDQNEELFTLLEGAEEAYGRFLLQVSCEGAELTFRTLGGSVAGTLSWPMECRAQELPLAAREAIRSSGFKTPLRCEWKFVLPNGTLLDTTPTAASLQEQLAPKYKGG